MTKPAYDNPVVALPNKVICDWLRATGITKEDDKVTDVIIHIPIDCVIKVYVTRLGDERMFTVAPPDLSGAVVIAEGGSDD